MTLPHFPLQKTVDSLVIEKEADRKQEPRVISEPSELDRRGFVRTLAVSLGLSIAVPTRPEAALNRPTPIATRKVTHLRWISVREIYGDGNHNAWPDICRWKDRYYVIFNSGGKHHGAGHGVTLLSSIDGETWEKVFQTRSDEWGVIAGTTRTALCPKLLPTKDKLIVLFYFYTSGSMDVTAEEKAELKRRW